jgi:tetratricopeptide (TPR) repeat protein
LLLRARAAAGREDQAAAREFLQRAFDVCPPEDADFRRKLLSLQAEVDVVAGSLDSAEGALREAVTSIEACSAPRNHLLLPLLDRLAGVLVLQDRSGEAEAVVRRTLRLAEQTFGRRHRETAVRQEQLGALLMQLGRNEEAEQVLAEAAELHEDHGGADPEPLVNSLRLRADALQRLQRPLEAARVEERAAALEGRSRHVLEDIL